MSWVDGDHGRYRRCYRYAYLRFALRLPQRKVFTPLCIFSSSATLVTVCVAVLGGYTFFAVPTLPPSWQRGRYRTDPDSRRRGRGFLEDLPVHPSLLSANLALTESSDLSNVPVSITFHPVFELHIMPLPIRPGNALPAARSTREASRLGGWISK